MSSKSEFKVPKHVTIAGRKIRIILDPHSDDHGRYYHMQKTIIIDPDKEDPHASLIHEMMHAALAAGGLTEILDEKMEEAICCAAELLAPCLKLHSAKVKIK
jgi:hypothetical protein